MPPNSLPPARDVRATTLRSGDATARPGTVSIPVETPVEIVFGDVPFAVMMLTPADLDAFGLGFCLTEGIIASRADIRRMSVSQEVAGLRLSIELAPDRMSQHLTRRRAISGRTGCGVCGVEDLGSLACALPDVRTAPAVAMPALGRALAAMEERQTLNARTHAVHAAAWSSPAGEVSHLFEDVGRHNALDKLIGGLLGDGVDPASGFILITSRCSFEMVDKAAAFGAGLLVAVSAPTSLALERAERLGMRLVAIARHDGVTVFLDGSGALDLVA